MAFIIKTKKKSHHIKHFQKKMGKIYYFIHVYVYTPHVSDYLHEGAIRPTRSDQVTGNCEPIDTCSTSLWGLGTNPLTSVFTVWFTLAQILATDTMKVVQTPPTGDSVIFTHSHVNTTHHCPYTAHLQWAAQPHQCLCYSSLWYPRPGIRRQRAWSELSHC